MVCSAASGGIFPSFLAGLGSAPMAGSLEGGPLGAHRPHLIRVKYGIRRASGVKDGSHRVEELSCVGQGQPGRGRMGADRDGPLFETTAAKGRLAYKLFACSVFAGVCLVWVYRATHVPGEGWGRWAWLGLLAADFWFGLYWVLTQSVRWNPTYRRTFPDRLSRRSEKELPGVDAFVCTADPTIEPPALVVSTVLSVMAYDYPAEKLAAYLSDDGGSDLTFYALLEASRFARVWIPFCKRLQLEPRSPAAYFREVPAPPGGLVAADEWWAVQKSHKEMENKIGTATKLGRIPEEIRREHKGFLEWNSGTTRSDHQSIVQILIDGRDPDALDDEGHALPTLVYVAREKRPHRHHNFKAGAMNSLMRISSEISNGEIILNVDCDMYSNNPRSVRDALCFFMDEEKGHEIGYVQFPQKFNNTTKNDIYSNSLRMFNEVDFYGLDNLGGPLYVGSGCFHRRWSLLGSKYKAVADQDLKRGKNRNVEESTFALEEKAKLLATCTYEDNTQWGKEVGLKYGCPVEDVITGLSIQCRGWKSIYFNPTRAGFLGVAPVTLEQTLVQHKRWSEGDFQIFFSKYCPFIYGHGKIQLGLQMAYSMYCLWAPNSVPTLYYVIVPSLSMLNNISLFPKVSSIWFIPFAYVIIATFTYSIWESLRIGFTFKAWLNERRMWLYKRTTSYFFAFIDNLLKQLGFDRSTFVITAKVADEDVADRYEKEVMEFGSSSLMFIILATLALLNLVCLVAGAKKLLLDDEGFEEFFLQFVICSLLVLVNVPLYQGLFFREDSAHMPTRVTVTSAALVLLVCLVTSL